MKALMFLFTLMVLPLSYAGDLASLMKVDPYSQTSIKQHFPDTIDQYPHPTGKKGQWSEPNLERVDYARLVPHLISVIQDQQREIEKLKNAQQVP